MVLAILTSSDVIEFKIKSFARYSGVNRVKLKPIKLKELTVLASQNFSLPAYVY